MLVQRQYDAKADGNTNRNSTCIPSCGLLIIVESEASFELSHADVSTSESLSEGVEFSG